MARSAKKCDKEEKTEKLKLKKVRPSMMIICMHALYYIHIIHSKNNFLSQQFVCSTHHCSCHTCINVECPIYSIFKSN